MRETSTKLMISCTVDAAGFFDFSDFAGFFDFFDFSDFSDIGFSDFSAMVESVVETVAAMSAAAATAPFAGDFITWPHARDPTADGDDGIMRLCWDDQLRLGIMVLGCARCLPHRRCTIWFLGLCVSPLLPLLLQHPVSLAFDADLSASKPWLDFGEPSRARRPGRAEGGEGKSSVRQGARTIASRADPPLLVHDFIDSSKRDHVEPRTPYHSPSGSLSFSLSGSTLLCLSVSLSLSLASPEKQRAKPSIHSTGSTNHHLCFVFGFLCRAAWRPPRGSE